MVDTIGETVNMINAKVADLDTKMKSIDERVTDTEREPGQLNCRIE